MKPLKLLVVFFILFLSNALFAQVSKDAAVLITVTLAKTPATITLNWTLDANATGYDVYRRDFGTSNWGSSKKHLAKSAIQYVDTTVKPGQKYEYQVKKTLKDVINIIAYGYT